MRRNPFTTVRSEGALLPPDFLQRLIDPKSKVDGLTPATYHLAEGERLNEAASRAWNRLLGLWAAFQGASVALKETDPATGLTRERWLLPLFQELGYGRLQSVKSFEIDGRLYPISHVWARSPIHLVGRGVDLDTRTAGVAGAAKTTPHGLVQEFLNRSVGYLWGFVSNGLRLRVLRNSKSFTRQAFVEFDLLAMFEGQVFADFALLWLLCHESRVESREDHPEECWLELWTERAREDGTRALDQLREGVEAAIKALGRGFLKRSSNRDLLDKLRSGALTTQDYYRQLLREVYRLIFLFVAEDRDLLLTAAQGSSAQKRYGQFYSAARLRTLAARRRGSQHTDLRQGLCFVVRELSSDAGCPALGLPALGSFLWSDRSTPDLDSCELANADLLDATRALAFTIDRGVRLAVDYRNLGPEELGSVYESLLELHPQVNADAASFDLKSAAGNERKTTGSYYTPTSLIECLLDSALDPVLEEAARAPDPVGAILSLKVCDPACGSGHFLIAAARRIANRLAAIRTGDDEPSPQAVRHATRDVVGRCIYGVDVNPMAVELCKVNLWLEALEPGRPLSFLENRIQNGNALLGTTPTLLKDGIPDAAFEPIEGDDADLCRELKKRNKMERVGFRSLFTTIEPLDRLSALAADAADIEGIEDVTSGDVREKETRYAALVASDEYAIERLYADAWCAAFVQRKTAGAFVITEDTFRTIERDPPAVPTAARLEIERLAAKYRFMHWHLAFPDVFKFTFTDSAAPDTRPGWSGGFDVVLGNPPWDKIQPEEQKFFAGLREDIAGASTGAKRKKLIEGLSEEDPPLFQLWREHKQRIDSMCHFVRGANLLPLTSAGNLNLYRLFAELSLMLIRHGGRVGMILQTGLATDENSSKFITFLFSSNLLRRFLDFENRGTFFPDVHAQFRFALVTLGAAKSDGSQAATEFGWLLHSLSDTAAPGRLIRLTAEDLSLFNPESHTCPTFKSERDLAVNRRMYQRACHVGRATAASGSHIDFLGELFNMTRASALFVSADADRSDDDYLPLYEAKSLHQFDHRYAGLIGGAFVECSSELKRNPFFTMPPRYFVKAAEVNRRLNDRGIAGQWFFGFRDVSSATNERTAIGAVFPRAAVGNSINLILGLTAVEALQLLANINSTAFDYATREKMSGMHLNIWIFRQLPMLPLSDYTQTLPWLGGPLRDWVLLRAMELAYTAWDLEPFANACGWDGPPFVWDDARRALIRCELDAVFFHLYGVAREDVAYILEAFPIVRRSDEEAHGEYRTKRVILELYDQMQLAIDTKRLYATVLDPPPADPRVAHPSRREPLGL